MEPVKRGVQIIQGQPIKLLQLIRASGKGIFQPGAFTRGPLLTQLGGRGDEGAAEKIFTSANPTPTLSVSAQATRPVQVAALNNELSKWARRRAMTNIATQRTLGGA